MFKSQNASTWEPDQNKDLKFTIRRAEFPTTGTNTAVFNIQDPLSIENYHTLFTNVSTILPTGAAVTGEAKAYNGSAFETDYSPINIMQNINYTFLKQLAGASGIGGTSLQLRATLSTTDSQVSPAIDASTLAVVTALNSINNDASGEAAVKAGGTALARYLTKPINLAAGFEASNLNVTVDVNAPPGTSIKVYYKTLPTEKTTPISDESWVLMKLETAVPASSSGYDFKEYRYFPSGAFDSYGVPQNNPIAPRFNVFQIKIVLLSSSQAATPRIRILRAIALDS